MGEYFTLVGKPPNLVRELHAEMARSNAARHYARLNQDNNLRRVSQSFATPPAKKSGPVLIPNGEIASSDLNGNGVYTSIFRDRTSSSSEHTMKTLSAAIKDAITAQTESSAIKVHTQEQKPS